MPHICRLLLTYYLIALIQSIHLRFRALNSRLLFESLTILTKRLVNNKLTSANNLGKGHTFAKLCITAIELQYGLVLSLALAQLCG